jgi:type III restriction enzyme
MMNEKKREFLSELKVRMSLRKPQWEALQIFAELVELMEWKKVLNESELNQQLEKVRQKHLTVTSFERTFPSVSFSLATGIGKTRLMAGVMCYLHMVKSVKNFFVVAPNRTIYHKLRKDFSVNYEDKYVFSGLGEFIPNAPHIVDENNFNSSMFFSDLNIHIFNISKFTHGRGRDTELARVNRLNEGLGESYFNYLVGLPDLCIMMDESHHYHGEQGFAVINDLNPVIGVEFTATPQIPTTRGHSLFKNVVYEYSLAHALDDKKYIKEPAVCTRQNFVHTQYQADELDKIKLNDGIKIHKKTKAQLEEYSLNHGKSLVKPFVLVVARDINHSNALLDYIKSQSFENGYYENKVIEVNSKQGNVESDENMQLLLNLESPDNRVEIVIHVNKLKEGWDVKNLYTIIPLRASVSEILTEQTIGRGLRLPFGERTGIEELDRLSIVCHDRYADIVAKANMPDSIVRKSYYIEDSVADDPSGANYETVEVAPVINELLNEDNVSQVIKDEMQDVTDEHEQAIMRIVSKKMPVIFKEANNRISKQFIENKESKIKELVTNEIRNEVHSIIQNDEKREQSFQRQVERTYEYIVRAMDNHCILIPEIVRGFSEVPVYRFEDFTLNTERLDFRPIDNAIIGQQLSRGGRQFSMFDDDEDELYISSDRSSREVIIGLISAKDNIDYTKCASLINSLVNDAIRHFNSYLSAEDTEKVMRQQAKTIADIVHVQMNAHFVDSEKESIVTAVRYSTNMGSQHIMINSARAFVNFTTTVRPNEISCTAFEGFVKSVFPRVKFDSLPELEFVRVMERDGEVSKWMKPKKGDIKIQYGILKENYIPDFIVETASLMYIMEVKASNMMRDEVVLEKARAAIDFCEIVNRFAGQNNEKLWKYVLLDSSEINATSSFGYLMSRGKHDGW